MLVVHLASESTAGFYVAVGSLQAGRVFPKVFPMLCIFTDTAENGAGVASESPSVLYAVTRMFKNCWLCSLNTHCTAAVSSYPTFFFWEQTYLVFHKTREGSNTLCLQNQVAVSAKQYGSFIHHGLAKILIVCPLALAKTEICLQSKPIGIWSDQQKRSCFEQLKELHVCLNWQKHSFSME